MTSLIQRTFTLLRRQHRKALIPYLVVGYPHLKTTSALILECERAGADMIELGLPFSDPVADGPLIQQAMHDALHHSISLDEFLRWLMKLRRQTKIPLVLMTYANLIYHYGIVRFFENASAAGLNGLIIPDLPTEEGGEWSRAGKKKNIDQIFLLAPTTPPSRIQRISALSNGFIYYVSLLGVTGSKLRNLADVARDVQRVNRTTSKPLAVGFGISTPKEAKALAAVSDGIIIGSALIKVIQEHKTYPAIVKSVARTIQNFRQAIS